MTRTRKILGVSAIVLAVLVGAGAYMLSHNDPCEPGPAPAGEGPRMKAFVYRCYGAPEVVKLEDVEKPIPKANELLVRVRAASVNPLDWHFMRGEPYVMRMSAGFGKPTDITLGVDFSGTVEAVGRDVTRFKPGDAVFGGRNGAFAEYLRVREDRVVALKPDNISFEQGAAVAIAAVTALQALREHGQVKAGQKVLVNGASGGVGTFAVQLAKYLGAEVTGVCSTRNVELVRSLGADRVIDYTREDFTQGGERYDVIVDNVGNHAFLDLRHVMTPQGRLVVVGGPGGRWIGALTKFIEASVVAPFMSEEQQITAFFASMTQEDMNLLRDLMQSGKVTPVVDRTYPFTELPQALAYLETGRARGKVVVTVP
jgi:NADPH:quinone reductase-like Zn-dependent oxidoreductase